MVFLLFFIRVLTCCQWKKTLLQYFSSDAKQCLNCKEKNLKPCFPLWQIFIFWKLVKSGVNAEGSGCLYTIHIHGKWVWNVVIFLVLKWFKMFILLYTIPIMIYTMHIQSFYNFYNHFRPVRTTWNLSVSEQVQIVQLTLLWTKFSFRPSI